MQRDIAKGDVPILVMAILAEAPCHGYAIAREIERRSEGRFTMKEGTLYPALRVLEGDGFIEGSWEIQPSGPARKVYRLTPRGESELTKRAREWRAYARTVEGIVGTGGENVQPA